MVKDHCKLSNNFPEKVDYVINENLQKTIKIIEKHTIF